MLVRSHECVAASALGMGGPELAAAERSARRLTELAPYRERGYRLLMRALAARDSVGEALLVFEQLRKILRDELGTSPGAATQALQRQLLDFRPVGPVAEKRRNSRRAAIVRGADVKGVKRPPR